MGTPHCMPRSAPTLYTKGHAFNSSTTMIGITQPQCMFFYRISSNLPSVHLKISVIHKRFKTMEISQHVFWDLTFLTMGDDIAQFLHLKNQIWIQEKICCMYQFQRYFFISVICFICKCLCIWCHLCCIIIVSGNPTSTNYSIICASNDIPCQSKSCSSESCHCS